jgi:hypothetical protein
MWRRTGSREDQMRRVARMASRFRNAGGGDVSIGARVFVGSGDGTAGAPRTSNGAARSESGAEAVVASFADGDS